MTTLSATESAPPQMSKFEQRFRLWLAGFGMSSEQCDTLCADRRIALSIRTKDYGGIVQDLSGCVYGSGYTPELLAALNDPGEMLFLIQVLRT